MDHAEARELLEVAAVEPGGLARLMAGDTPEAAALAAHLAGCDACTAEMARLRDASGILRGVVRTTPPPELRERTLALVRAVGRDRSSGAVAATPGGAAVTALPAPSSLRPAASATDTKRTGRPAPRGPLAGLLGLAAVLAIAIVGTGLLVGGQRDAAIAARDATIERQEETVKDLADVTIGTLRVVGQPDARHVALASASGSGATGSVVFSQAGRELVVTATGIAAPDAGHEFRCWIETGGQRQAVGKMFFGGGLAYWVGPVAALGSVRPGSTFGVSLVDLANPSVAADAILTGKL